MINHKNLKIWVNDVLKFSQNSLWSGDQQVNVELINGLNVIEVQLNKGRRAGGIMPPVYLYIDPGQVLSNTELSGQFGNLSRVGGRIRTNDRQTRKSSFRSGSCRPAILAKKNASYLRQQDPNAVFDNPDIMMHNWVLLKPGSLNEIGYLADKLAAQPDGMEKEYLPDSDKIIVASKLLGPKASRKLYSLLHLSQGNIPTLVPSRTLRARMQGVLTVVKPGPVKKVTVASHDTKLFDPNSPDRYYQILHLESLLPCRLIYRT